MKSFIAILTIAAALISGYSEYRAIIIEDRVRFEDYEINEDDDDANY
tara:strand:- start:16 stop:156 length:141 start_codon:yes stop_codon:yes gene_type:complete